MLSISTKTLGLVAASHPANASKPFSVALLGCVAALNSGGLLAQGKSRTENKALIETSIRVLRESEKCAPGGLHSPCLGFE